MKNAVAEIGFTHSHQSVLIRHLAETVHFIGLKVCYFFGQTWNRS
jgi:hypothetical protein